MHQPVLPEDSRRMPLSNQWWIYSFSWLHDACKGLMRDVLTTPL